MNRSFEDDVPFFSVIIPCYKQADLLSAALDSLLSQDYTSWEAIVVNDGSPDNTQSVTQKNIDKDRRIKLVSKENGGLSSARNAGLRVAKGHWFLFLDADDYILPGCLKILYQTASNLNKETLLQFGYRYINLEGDRILHETTPPSGGALIPSILSGNIGPCHSLIISRSLVSKVGYFDESLASAEDWDFWIRAAKAGAGIQKLNQILVVYRINLNSMSRQPKTMYKAMKSVALRAVCKDERIDPDYPLNKDYDKAISSVSIQRSFVLCLGVALVQKKIDLACKLFQEETAFFGWKWTAENWLPINSYLSFRYLSNRGEVRRVLSEYRSNVREFFDCIGLNKREQEQALKLIFSSHLKKRNIQKWGFAGRLFNKFLLN